MQRVLKNVVRVVLGLVSLGLSGCSPEIEDRSRIDVSGPDGPVHFWAAVRANGYPIVSVQAVTEDGLRVSLTGPTSPAEIAHFEARAADLPCRRTILYRIEVKYQTSADDPTATAIAREPPTGWNGVIYETPTRTGCTPVSGRFYYVDTPVDLADGSCDVLGRCSLRAAIMASNRSAGNDTIRIPNGTYELTRGGAEAYDGADDRVGDLDLTDSATLEPTSAIPDITVDARRRHRVFQVHRGSVRMRDLKLTRGYELAVPGGAIDNGANLELDRVAFVDNSLDFAALNSCFNSVATVLCSKGGAIANRGSLQVERSRFVGNTAGPNGWGGALFNYGPGATSVITRSYFEDNRALYAGAIANHQGRVEVLNSTFFDRGLTMRDGVAVYNAGTFLLRNATLLTNSETSLLHNEGTSSFSLANDIVANERGTAPRLCAGTFANYGGNWLGGTSVNLATYTLPCTLSPPNPPEPGPFRNEIAQMSFFWPNSWETDPPDVVVPTVSAPLLDYGPGAYGCPWRDQLGRARPADANGDGSARCDPGAYEVGAR